MKPPPGLSHSLPLRKWGPPFKREEVQASSSLEGWLGINPSSPGSIQFFLLPAPHPHLFHRLCWNPRSVVSTQTLHTGICLTLNSNMGISPGSREPPFLFGGVCLGSTRGVLLLKEESLWYPGLCWAQLLSQAVAVTGSNHPAAASVPPGIALPPGMICLLVHTHEQTPPIAQIEEPNPSLPCHSAVSS